VVLPNSTRRALGYALLGKATYVDAMHPFGAFGEFTVLGVVSWLPRALAAFTQS